MLFLITASWVKEKMNNLTHPNSVKKHGVDFPSYPDVPKLVLLVFCGYVIIWYLQIGTRIDWLGLIRIEFVVACLLIPPALYFFANPDVDSDINSDVKNRSSLGILVIAFFILLAVMTIFSYDVQHSWQVFFNRVIKFAFMGLFIVCFVKSPNAMRFFLAAFLLACMKMGQEGMVGQLTGSLVWQNQGVMRLHGSTLLYRHPNSFSGMALGTLPFILYLYPLVNKYIKIFFLVLLVFDLNIILHTGSRTGYVGFIGIVLVFLFRSKKKVTHSIILIIGLLVFMQFAPQQYMNRFRSIYTSPPTDNSPQSLYDGESSKDKRIEIVEDALIIFKENPLGVGVSAFPLVRAERFGRVQDTHNLYLEIATNLGVQGLVLFGFMILALLRCLHSSRNEFKAQIDSLTFHFSDNNLTDEAALLKPHLADLRFMVAVCDSVILFVVLRLILGIFGMDLYEIYWWFSVGLAIAAMHICAVAGKRTDYLINV